MTTTIREDYDGYKALARAAGAMRDDPSEAGRDRLLSAILAVVDHGELRRALDNDILRRATAGPGSEGYYAEVVDYTSGTRFHG